MPDSASKSLHLFITTISQNLMPVKQTLLHYLAKSLFMIGDLIAPVIPDDACTLVVTCEPLRDNNSISPTVKSLNCTLQWTAAGTFANLHCLQITLSNWVKVSINSTSDGFYQFSCRVLLKNITYHVVVRIYFRSLMSVAASISLWCSQPSTYLMFDVLTTCNCWAETNSRKY